jgi:hypothetical protein
VCSSDLVGMNIDKAWTYYKILCHKDFPGRCSFKVAQSSNHSIADAYILDVPWEPRTVNNKAAFNDNIKH